MPSKRFFSLSSLSIFAIGAMGFALACGDNGLSTDFKLVSCYDTGTGVACVDSDGSTDPQDVNDDGIDDEFVCSDGTSGGDGDADSDSDSDSDDGVDSESADSSGVTGDSEDDGDLDSDSDGDSDTDADSENSDDDVDSDSVEDSLDCDSPPDGQDGDPVPGDPVP